MRNQRASVAALSVLGLSVVLTSGMLAVGGLGTAWWARFATGAAFLGRADVTMQRSALDCGPIALEECCRLLEISTPHDTTIPVGPRGVTLRDLRLEAVEWGLEARSVRGVPLDDLNLPAILHWKRGHYVVLVERIDHDAWIVHDPAWGRLRYRRAELEARWSGWALVFGQFAAPIGR